MAKHQFVECVMPGPRGYDPRTRQFVHLSITRPMPWHYGRTLTASIRRAYGTTNARFSDMCSLSWIVMGFVEELDNLGKGMFWFFKDRYLELGYRP